MIKTKDISSKSLTIFFLVAIMAPNIIMFSGLEKKDYQSAFPKFDINSPISSIGKLKSYYLQNFGLKKTLVDNYIDLKSNYLNENPIPNRVIKGKDNWLFLGNHSNNVLNNSFGNTSFKPNELKNTIQYLKKLKTYLESQNISFYLVIPPDKNNIYQEFLPYQLKQNKTKLDVLIPLLKQNNINLINLSKPLFDNKNKQQLYIKTDTHWNDYGAFVGYDYTLSIIDKNNNLHRETLNDYNVIHTKTKKGDIGRMINFITEADNIIFRRKTESQSKLINSTKTKLHYINPNQKLKLLMYRDSFTNATIKYFNESFAETVYIKSHIYKKTTIESFKPDIVLFEIIERNIDFIGNQ